MSLEANYEGIPVRDPERCGECQRRPMTHEVVIKNTLGESRFRLCELCAHMVGSRAAMRSKASGWAVRVECCGNAGYGEQLRRPAA